MWEGHAASGCRALEGGFTRLSATFLRLDVNAIGSSCHPWKVHLHGRFSLMRLITLVKRHFLFMTAEEECGTNAILNAHTYPCHICST